MLPTRWLSLLLILTLSAPATAARRRGMVPGSPSICSFGVVASDVWVQAMALDTTTIYYVDDLEEGLYAVSKQGGTPRRVSGVDPGIVLSMVVDDTHVYFTLLESLDSPIRANVFRVPKGGGTPTALALDVLFPVTMAVDATHLYWVSLGTVALESETIPSDGKIERWNKSTAVRETLADGLSAPTSLALDGGDIYFGETGLATGNVSAGIRRMAKAGGTVTKVIDGLIVVELAMSGSEIVFTGGDSEDEAPRIFVVPKNGGTRRELVVDESIWGDLIVAGGQVYYGTLSDDDEIIASIAIAGGVPVTMVRETHFDTDDFEVDECGIFYVTLDEIVRSPR